MPEGSCGQHSPLCVYRIADRLEEQLKFGDYVKEAVLEQLKRYQRKGWHIEFSRTDLGEKAIAQRV
jgi:hypothetical protein